MHARTPLHPMVKVKEKEKESKKEAVKCKDIPKNIVLQRCIYTSCAGFGFLCVLTTVSKGTILATHARSSEVLYSNSAGGQ